MESILFYARVFVAAVSLIAVFGAPFVIMNSTVGSASVGYGITDTSTERAEAPINLVPDTRFAQIDGALEIQ